MSPLPVTLPELPGLLCAADVAATARTIADTQQPDGSIPWSPWDKVDVWNHVEAAMGALVGGEVAAAEAAYDWCARTQRDDGSWPMRWQQGEVVDDSTETNMCAYLAVGVWHHWRVRRDLAFVERLWPVVRRGLDVVVDLQLPFGGVAWSREWRGGEPGRTNAQALLSGSSSIYQALRAGVALATLLEEPQPEWELAGGRLGHALRQHRDRFLDKRSFAMDWYYPVLGGAVRGRAGHDLVASRWDDFVVPGLGIRCVDTNPWVTGAETCELVLALDCLDDRDRALRLLADVQHLRNEAGGYWTGYVWPDDAVWPREQTTYTAAAVVLAVDALSRTTPGSGIMRGDDLAPHFAEIGLECGCSPRDLSADVLAR
ncbi:prenyltransferase [Nocardioides marmoraquaticus]